MVIIDDLKPVTRNADYLRLSFFFRPEIVGFCVRNSVFPPVPSSIIAPPFDPGLRVFSSILVTRWSPAEYVASRMKGPRLTAVLSWAMER